MRGGNRWWSSLFLKQYDMIYQYFLYDWQSDLSHLLWHFIAIVVGSMAPDIFFFVHKSFTFYASSNVGSLHCFFWSLTANDAVSFCRGSKMSSQLFTLHCTRKMTKYLLVPDEDILSAPRPVVQQLRLRECESGSCSPSTVVSVRFLTIILEEEEVHCRCQNMKTNQNI